MFVPTLIIPLKNTMGHLLEEEKLAGQGREWGRSHFTLSIDSSHF